MTGFVLLGTEVILYSHLGGESMCANVVWSTKARFGDHVKLALNPSKIHVFDKETEQTVTN